MPVVASKANRKTQKLGIGDVAYPDGSVIFSKDWLSGQPTPVSLEVPEDSVEEDPNLKGINPNPKYYVVPKDGAKKVKVKVKAKN